MDFRLNKLSLVVADRYVPALVNGVVVVVVVVVLVYAIITR